MRMYMHTNDRDIPDECKINFELCVYVTLSRNIKTQNVIDSARTFSFQSHVIRKEITIIMSLVLGQTGKLSESSGTRIDAVRYLVAVWIYGTCELDSHPTSFWLACLTGVRQLSRTH